jgi:AcrR family transcriptional regulator
MSDEHAPGALRGQAQRGAATRAAVVDAALAVFATRGYRAGALAEIGARVGLSPAGILYHFGSKDALLVAVIAERDRRASEAVARIVTGTGLATLRDVVGFAAVVERERGLAALHTVLQAESFEPDGPAHAYFLGRSRVLRRGVEATLRAARDAGEVAADVDCAAKAAEFVAFLEGAAVLWLLDAEVSLTALYDSYITTFVAALAR